jgi:hypothetical protein
MKEYQSYIDEQKEAYYKIGAIKCAALSNEFIFFNKHGISHLIRKFGHNRTFTEQKRRFGLLRYCNLILENKDADVDYRVSINSKSKAEFFGITSVINGKKIRIVVRRVNGGRLLFLSIMDFE